MSRWTTTSIAARFLVEVLDAAGADVDPLLRADGLDRDALACADVAVPLATFRELWARAAAVDPAIGLTLVERFPPGRMHVLAHLALRAPTVGAALADSCRYASVTSATDALALEREGDTVRFTYADLAPGPANPWLAEHYFAMAVLFLQRACGRALPLRRVAFAGPRQAPADAYRQRFGRDPVFAAGGNALEFAAGALDWPLSTQDDYLHGILERVAQARVAAPADPLLAQVRAEIGRAVLRGTTPAMEDVAAHCRLGVRALRTRLARVPTTFRAVLDDVRRELARDHLARGLSVTETAYLLGFAEPAAFQHACRRWFDRPAGDLRRELLARPP